MIRRTPISTNRHQCQKNIKDRKKYRKHKHKCRRHRGCRDTSCDERSFTILCQDNGKLTYLNSISSYLNPEKMTCVAVECSMSELDATTAVRSPARAACFFCMARRRATSSALRRASASNSSWRSSPPLSA